jgi:hypothetical protein
MLSAIIAAPVLGAAIAALAYRFIRGSGAVG